MKIKELLLTKGQQNEVFDKITPKFVDMILKKVDDLKKCGMSSGDILIQIKRDHGKNGKKVAKLHSCLAEATHKLPKTKKEFEYLKTLFTDPLPAGTAIDAIRKIIKDDSLEDVIGHVEDSVDVRPILSTWIKTNYPTLIKHDDKRFDSEGAFSPLHGYNPE